MNLIWTCVLLHLAIYTAMFVIFYIFPTTFNIIGVNGYTGEVITTNSGTSSTGVPGYNLIGCEKGQICSAAVIEKLA